MHQSIQRLRAHPHFPFFFLRTSERITCLSPSLLRFNGNHAGSVLIRVCGHLDGRLIDVILCLKLLCFYSLKPHFQIDLFIQGDLFSFEMMRSMYCYKLLQNVPNQIGFVIMTSFRSSDLILKADVRRSLRIAMSY